MNTMTDCKTCRSHLPDLLLDPAAAARADLSAHLVACADCRNELAQLRSTFALLDEWKAPEPSPFFDSRLQARLREAVAAQPEGFWERARSFLLFSTGRQLRPAMAGALAVILLAGGGGTFATFYTPGAQNTPVSATVNDLKILDNNAQAEQQMDQLLDESGSSTDDGATLPAS
jgi:hypothetical protein